MRALGRILFSIGTFALLLSILSLDFKGSCLGFFITALGIVLHTIANKRILRPYILKNVSTLKDY